jgi:hypothetical protein
MYFCNTHCVASYSIFILNYIYRPLQCQLPGSATGSNNPFARGEKEHAQQLSDQSSSKIVIQEKPKPNHRQNIYRKYKNCYRVSVAI